MQIDLVAFHYKAINLTDSVSLHSVLITHKTLFSETACSQCTEITWNDLGFYSNISGIHFQLVTKQFLCKHYLKSIFNELTTELSPYSAWEISSLVLSFIWLVQLIKPNSLRNCFLWLFFFFLWPHPALNELTCQAPSRVRSISNDFFFPRRNKLFYVSKYADHFA